MEFIHYSTLQQCRDKVLLDCRANLKVDEIEEPAEEVRLNKMSQIITYTKAQF